MCVYVTLVNTMRNCAKCDISHDLCTNNDKSCNCKRQRQQQQPRATAASNLLSGHTRCRALTIASLLLSAAVRAVGMRNCLVKGLAGKALANYRGKYFYKNELCLKK